MANERSLTQQYTFLETAMHTEINRKQRVDEAIYRVVAIAAAVLIVMGVLAA